MKVRKLIATPTNVNELGHQFWIGKVLDVLMCEDENNINAIKVHWYNTRSKILESHDMTLDEDNALIATSEDEEDQSPSYISYSSNDNL